MKKSVLFALVLLLGFFTSTSFAVNVTLFGPTQYLRTKGKPNVYTATFPGTVGMGSLIIKTGDGDNKDRDNKDRRDKDQDRDNKDRDDKDGIRSALIFLNGQQILGPHDFGQKAYKTEIPVKLAEQNSLSVELRSEPGSYLTIQIAEEIIADAAAVIGPAGGTITPADATPINGAKVVIPPGALDRNLIITVDASDISSVIPEDYVPAGRAVGLGPSGIHFSGEVLVTVPYDDLDNDGIIDYTHVPEDLVEVVLYDSSTNGLSHPAIISQDKSAKTVTFGVTHFSSAVAIANDPARSDRNLTVLVIDGMNIWKTIFQDSIPFFQLSWETFPAFTPGYLRSAILGLPKLGLLAGDVISYNGLYSSDTTMSWNGNASDTYLLVPDLLAEIIALSRQAKNEGRKFAIATHSWGTVLATLALLYLPPQYDPDLFITLSSPLGTRNSFHVDGPLDHLAGPIITNYTDRRIDDTLQYMNVLSRRELTDFNFRWVNYWAGHDLISGPLVKSIDDQIDSSFTYPWERIITTGDWHALTALTDNPVNATASINLKEKIGNELTALFTSSPINVTGIWNGTYTFIPKTGTSKNYTVALNLTQSLNNVSGTWTTSSGRSGTLSGVVSGNIVTLTFISPYPCVGTINITGSVNINSMTTTSGNGSDCTGTYSVRGSVARTP